MSTKFSTVCLIAGVSVFGALLLEPSTSWLVRLQMNALAGTLAPGLQARSNDLLIQERSVADSQPNNFRIQLAFCLAQSKQVSTSAAALETTHQSEPQSLRGRSARALLTLLPRFGNRPELQAHILRYLCEGDLTLDRAEESILESASRQKEIADGLKEELAKKQPQIQPMSRGTFQGNTVAEAAAIRGETLDPSNAFFPTMLAVSLLTQHRDSEALLALDRAAQKPKWNDYAAGEVDANVALLSRASGSEIGGFALTAARCCVELPQASRIRSLARVVTALAVKRELRGDRDGGLRLRRSVARIGATMRNGGTFLTPFVGASLVTCSAIRPGGAPTADSALICRTPDAGVGKAYVAYLRTTGQPGEATWFTRETEAGQQVLRITDAVNRLPDGGVHPAVVLVEWWAASLFIFVSFLMTTACGGMAVLLARTRSVRTGSGLDCGAVWALAIVAGHLALLIAKCLAGNGNLYLAPIDIASFELVVCSTVVFGIKRGRSWQAFATSIYAFALTLVTLVAAVALSTWLGNGPTAPLRLLGFIFDDYLGCIHPFAGLSIVELLGIPVLGLQAIFVANFAIRSRVTRTPISVRIVRGYRRVAASTCGVLLLLYSVSVIGTLIQESRVQTHVARQLQNQGKYEAETLGVAWPGPVAVPATDIAGAGN